MTTTAPPPVPRRRIRGASAVLLPFDAAGAPDLEGLRAHTVRTIEAGLTPALNMDTGYGPALDPGERERVLAEGAALGVEFVGGVHVDDSPGAGLDVDRYRQGAAEVTAAGGVPILFPSFGTAGATDDELVAMHRAVADEVDRFLGFELGPMFHPAGRIFTTEVFTELLGIPAMVGLKHSSLRRDAEWERLAIRDRVRPGWSLMTGNDLAIDLVTVGSDYLLGLSTFAPDAFAARDRAWEEGDEARFWELNDVLQHLGRVTFRAPVPAYRHDAAMFLHLRGQVATDRVHPDCPLRPSWEGELLAEILGEVEAVLGRTPG